MRELKFKTNIDCSGCVSAVTPFLNKTEGIKNWQVDTSSPNKILTIESEGASEDKVINAVKKAGFIIEKI